MRDLDQYSLREIGLNLRQTGDFFDIGESRARVYALQNYRDDRGALGIIDFTRDLPFSPQRVFYAFNVPSDQVRGEHAHRECQQFLICLSGTCTLQIEDSKNKFQVLMDSPLFGVWLPPMIWSSQFDFSTDATLFVLASEEYVERDYIRLYEEFRQTQEVVPS